MKTEEPRITTGHIAQNIHSLHKEGVLREMKKLFLEELREFFVPGESGEFVLDPSKIIEVPCPICSTPKKKAAFEIKINGFEHLRCQVCDNIYVTPRLKDEYIWKQYGRPSYQYMFQHLIEDTIAFRKNVIATGKYQWVTKRLPSHGNKTLLDIGSGLGENLAVYKEHGWDVVGIEFNEYASKRSRELFGVSVLNEPIEKAKLPRQYFDLISMWGVLEHLTNPIDVLGSILQHLAPGGSLVFMTPQFDCLTTSFLKEHPELANRHLDGDKHITVFTRKGVEFLARKMNLEIVDIVTRGLDLTTILEYVENEKETRLFKLIQKELPTLQKAIEEAGFGDGLWAILRKP